MLCPKCGFISFDHLSLCVKCHNDLSQVGSDLHGTATDAACRQFLGLVLKTSSSSQENQNEIEETTVTFATPLEQEAIVQKNAQRDVTSTNDLDGKELATTLSADDSPALEFDLDEIPHLDISGFEQAAAEKGSKVPVEEAIPGTGEASFDLRASETDDQNTFAFETPSAEESQADDQPKNHAESLEINSFSLSLDSDEEAAQPSGPPSAEDELSEPLSIDLDEIDLSDLVHDQSRTAPIGDEAQASSEESGPDYEDTMDLSLFGNEDSDVAVDSIFSTGDSGLEPIDLTLMDEALVELAVDPGRKESPFQKESPSGDLELSMEDDRK